MFDDGKNKRCSKGERRSKRTGNCYVKRSVENCGPGLRRVNGDCIDKDLLPQPKKRTVKNCPKGFKRVGKDCVEKSKSKSKRKRCKSGKRKVGRKCVDKDKLPLKESKLCKKGSAKNKSGKCQKFIWSYNGDKKTRIWRE